VRWISARFTTDVSASVGSADAISHYRAWQRFVDEANRAAPLAAGDALASSWVWVRAWTETLVLRSMWQARAAHDVMWRVALEELWSRPTTQRQVVTVARRGRRASSRSVSLSPTQKSPFNCHASCCRTRQACLVAFACSFAALCVFTRSPRLAAFATLTVACIVLVLFGVMSGVLGWAFGSIEAVSMIIFVGYAVDYTLHLAQV
jgi:hypothetical protein